MEISGKIIDILEVKSGKSANGEWRKQEYVLETEAEYPKKVCFMAWGDKIDQFNIQQGETVAVSIDLESREYNGRWYTDVKAWKVSRDDATAGSPPPFADHDRYEPSSMDGSPIGDDDIPF
ncbi:MAG: DUF3127 domain-containing protein [Tateyamaria sp.]|nr:DUF3127 domain-containing protein [Tateyamaria sp.]